MPISQSRRRELLAEVFGGLEPPLLAGCAAWLDGSARFAEFAERYRDKIRRKLRVARDTGGRLDVLAELSVAHRLLADRRCELGYEPIPADGGGGPDFDLAFRVNTHLAVEVARLRPAEAEGVAGQIVGVTCAKLAQCRPGTANVVALVVEGAAAEPALEDAGRRLLALAGGAEPAYLARCGFPEVGEFRRPFQRLSALWLLGGLFVTDAVPGLWLNPRARHPLPSPLTTLLRK